MRESEGIMGVFIIAITFILIFSGFLSVSVGYSKAFKVKNEIVNIIERNKGFSTFNDSGESTQEEIADYMASVGYRSVGKCKEGYVGYTTGSKGEVYTNPMYCVKTVYTSGNSVETPSSAYYQVQVFYGVDIPVIRVFAQLSVEGTSREIIFPVR